MTLAVSERTSCRNLNGLKAIVGVRIRSAGNVVSRRDFSYFRNPDSLSCAQPSLEGMSRQAGLDCPGISMPRRISVKTGRQQVPLSTVGRASGQGTDIGPETGRSGRARTCDPRFWRPMLSPTELRSYRVASIANHFRDVHAPFS